MRSRVSEEGVGDQETVHNVLPWVPRIALGAVFISLVAALNRGLVMGDEGFVLLTASQPSEYISSASQAHMIWGIPWRIMGFVPFLRLVGLVAIMAASLVLAQGVITLLRCQRPRITSAECAAVRALIMLASLLIYGVIYLSPGYNHLAFIGASLFTGGTVRALHEPDLNAKKSQVRVIGATTGLGWVLLSFAKPVSAAVLVPVLVLIYYREQQFISDRVKNLAIGFTISLVSVCILVSAFGPPIHEIITGTVTGMVNEPNKYDLGTMLGHYWDGIILAIKELITRAWWLAIFVPTVVALLVMASGRMQNPKFLSLGFLLAAVTLAMGIFAGGTHAYHGAGYDPRKVTGLALVLPVLFGLLTISYAVKRLLNDPVTQGEHGTRSLKSGYVLLAIQPLLVSLGTDWSLLEHATMSLAAWVGLLILLVKRLDSSSIGLLVFICSLALLFSPSIVTGVWFRSFQQAPLTEAKVLIEEGPASGLYVAEPVARNINTIHELFENLGSEKRADRYMMTIFVNPGLVFATGATQPISAWTSAEAAWRVREGLDEACSRPDPKSIILWIYPSERVVSWTEAVIESTSCRNFEWTEIGKLKSSHPLWQGPPHLLVGTATE